MTIALIHPLCKCTDYLCIEQAVTALNTVNWKKQPTSWQKLWE